MELFLRNTASGLQPLYDDDYEEKRKLKIGETYKAKITKARNVRFHKKYFALLNVAWEFIPEAEQEDHFNNNVENFRKSVLISAGHCDRIWLPDYEVWAHSPKSISFSKVDELEFTEIYNNTLNVILLKYLEGISREEIENEITPFL